MLKLKLSKDHKLIQVSLGTGLSNIYTYSGKCVFKNTSTIHFVKVDKDKIIFREVGMATYTFCLLCGSLLGVGIGNEYRRSIRECSCKTSQVIKI